MLPAALAAAGAGLRRAVAELGRAGLLRSHQAQAVASLTILAENNAPSDDRQHGEAPARRRGWRRQSGGTEREANPGGDGGSHGVRSRSRSRGSATGDGSSSGSGSRGRDEGSMLSFAASSSRPREQQRRRLGWRPEGGLAPLMDALHRCRTCFEVLQRVLETDEAAGQQRVHIHVLSKALDTMKQKAKHAGGSEPDRQAVGQLLQLAVERFSGFQTRQLVAFMRCAAAFPTLLQPAQLRAWQAALRQCSLQDASAQDVSNIMLALGTLAESDSQLAAVISQPLATRLLQHAVQLAKCGKLSTLQHVGNTVYGAALLGLQPSAAQMRQLSDETQQALQQPPRKDDYTAVTQILLACADWCNPQVLAGAAPTPAENPFMRYYPGAHLVDTLLHRATRSALNTHAATMLVNACGRVLHMPAPEEWAALMAASDLHADKRGSIGASALLVGCAQLGVAPPAATIEACVTAVEQSPLHDSGRSAANVVWALAVLQACDLRTWERLIAVASREGSSLVEVQQAQVSQAHLLMQLRYSNSLPCPRELLQRSRAAWHDQLVVRQRQGRTFSQIESLLAAAVAELASGHAVVAGHIVHSGRGEPLLLVDVALPQLRIAVEADGPTHFLRNRASKDGRPLPDGPTLARNHLLRHHGWHVVAVPYWVFNDAFETGALHAPALLSYLRQHTDLAAAIAERAAAAGAATE